MTKKDKPPYAFRREGNALVPDMEFDARALDGIAQGQRVKVTIQNWRNLDRQRLYWQMLTKVVEATDCAPTATHLHDKVRKILGYGHWDVVLGEDEWIPDSTKFSEMTEPEFVTYMDHVVALLADKLEIDPLEFYEKANA